MNSKINSIKVEKKGKWVLSYSSNSCVSVIYEPSLLGHNLEAISILFQNTSALRCFCGNVELLYFFFLMRYYY